MCEHQWGPYEGEIPYGENPRKFRFCSLCKAIGYVKTSAHGLNLGDKHKRRIYAFKCSVRKCGHDAVQRIIGRRDLRCAPLWTCIEHVNNYEGMIPKVRDW